MNRPVSRLGEILVRERKRQRNARTGSSLLARTGVLLSLLAVALAFVGLRVGSAEAGNIIPKYSETLSDFTLTIQGANFDSDDSHNGIHGTNWKVSYAISEDAGFINDELTVSGSAFHVKGPHGEGQNPNKFNFPFSVDADNYAQGVHTLTLQGEFVHVEHKDVFEAVLTFTVSTTANLDDITSYNLVVTGCHANSECPASVGGIAGLVGPDAPAESGAGSRNDPTPIAAEAAVAAVAAVLVVSAAVYMRLRRMRRS